MKWMNNPSNTTQFNKVAIFNKLSQTAGMAELKKVINMGFVVQAPYFSARCEIEC
jgi:hypothetical protein